MDVVDVGASYNAPACSCQHIQTISIVMQQLWLTASIYLTKSWLKQYLQKMAEQTHEDIEFLFKTAVWKN